jgi:hypothetical protein
MSHPLNLWTISIAVVDIGLQIFFWTEREQFVAFYGKPLILLGNWGVGIAGNYHTNTGN